jgi:urea transport system permease protein
LRAAVDSALSGLKLFAPERAVRLAAAHALQKEATPEQLPLLNKAYVKEKDPEIGALLQMLIATVNLHAEDPAIRKAAVKTLVTSANANLKPALQEMITNVLMAVMPSRTKAYASQRWPPSMRSTAA